MTPEKPKQAFPQLPATPGPAPVFGTPAGKKPKQKSQSAPYLGPDATPSIANAGFKTLVGQ